MDQAHKDTDKTLATLERRVVKVYKQAQADLEAKLADFNRRFDHKDKIHRKELADGKITKEQYQAWLKGQVFQGKMWAAKVAQITETLTNANQVAQQIINGEVNGVFANNANWMSYSLEHDVGLNFGFDLYDSSTVARLLRDQPELLPRRRVNIPKDQRWSQTQISRQITLGILEGENIYQIAERVAGITTRERDYALTNARTVMTGAQNAGRLEALDRAEQMGIKTKKEWVSTLDFRTRSNHRALDGQQVDIDRPFKIGQYKIRYPGDPHAHPSMVYNCRCTMVAVLVDYPDRNAERYDNIDGKKIRDMTYAEWIKAKQPAKPVEKPVETVQKPKRVLQLRGIRDKLGDEYVDRMQDILEKAENPALRDMYYRYGNRIKVVDKNLRSGAYFSPMDQGIHFNAEKVAKGDNLDNPYQTAFHEFGHNIDYLGGKDKMGYAYISVSYKNGLLPDLIKSDYLAFKKSMHARSNSALIEMLKAENMPIKESGSLSDILEGCVHTSYPLGVGHGAAYHKYPGATAKEFFAEVCDGAAANRASLDQLRRVFPNAVALVEEIMEVLTK